jgi:ATP-dependent Clp protease ATP-binding subunit ClpC
MLEEFSGRLKALGIESTVTEEGEAAQVGFDPDYGARPLRRAIRAQVEDPVASLLLSGELTAGSTLTVTAEEGKIVLLPSPLALSAG